MAMSSSGWKIGRTTSEKIVKSLISRLGSGEKVKWAKGLRNHFLRTAVGSVFIMIIGGFLFKLSSPFHTGRKCARCTFFFVSKFYFYQWQIVMKRHRHCWRAFGKVLVFSGIMLHCVKKKSYWKLHHVFVRKNEWKQTVCKLLPSPEHSGVLFQR